MLNILFKLILLPVAMCDPQMSGPSIGPSRFETMCSRGSLVFIYPLHALLWFSNWFYYQLQCGTRRWVDRASARAGLRWCVQGVDWFLFNITHYIFFSGVLIDFITCCNVGPADEWTEHRPEQVWDDVLQGVIGFIYSCNNYIFFSDVLIYFVTSCNVGPADEWTEHRPEQVWDNVLKGVIGFYLLSPTAYLIVIF